MKSKFLMLSLIIGGSLAVNSAYSQVHVNVSIGTPPPVIVETDFPGYAYYTYPAWNGHYRDRLYYEHYHASFERDNRGYFHGRSFDHSRFERERHVHPQGGRPGAGHPGYGHPGGGHPDGGHPEGGHPGGGHPEGGHPGGGHPDNAHPGGGHPGNGHPGPDHDHGHH